jgi:hypothetical protein
MPECSFNVINTVPMNYHMSKALVALIKKHPKLMDEYCVFIAQTVYEYERDLRVERVRKL